MVKKFFCDAVKRGQKELLRSRERKLEEDRLASAYYRSEKKKYTKFI